MRVIISGGGTGGHIFPAISIANAIMLRYPDAEVLFVGAEGRMEMTRVPAAGYQIVGLPVAGFNRKNILKNFVVVKKLITSLLRARIVIKAFKPDIAIGVGGYASGPLLKMASRMKVPTLIQEQNSYAGVTNKLLAEKADCICVAYKGMEQFFPEKKIILTGNPCRQDLETNTSKEDSLKFFNLDPSKKTVLILGGSLGARTLNNSILNNLDILKDSDVQIIWQAGERYISEISLTLDGKDVSKNIHVYDFINRMDLAYKAADLVVSRAGAGSISELSILGKATILVPSPNVAEDHQTKNALALVENNAAIMISDADAEKDLINNVLNAVNDNDSLNSLSENIKKMALFNSADRIVDQVDIIINKRRK